VCHEAQWLIDRQAPLAALGQHSSADCGYFAGWALKLLHRYNPGRVTTEGVQTSRRDVYEARESFLNAAPPVFTHRHGRSLQPQTGPAYLTRGLGLPSAYALRSLAPLRGNPPPNKFEVMARNYLAAPGNFGLLYVFIDTGTSGHWMAILGRRGPRPPALPTELLVYDSSGIGTDTQILGWKNAAAFNRYYGGTSPAGIVAASGQRATT
jgi:hypothetical protein